MVATHPNNPRRGRAWGEELAAANLTDGRSRCVSHHAQLRLQREHPMFPSHPSHPITSILSTASYPLAPYPLAPYPPHPSAFADAVFKANVGKYKTYYESLRSQLGITDFNPLTVDLTTPVLWGNDPDNCKMSDDSGAARQP